MIDVYSSGILSGLTSHEKVMGGVMTSVDDNGIWLTQTTWDTRSDVVCVYINMLIIRFASEILPIGNIFTDRSFVLSWVYDASFDS